MNNLSTLRSYLALWGRLCRVVGPGYPTMAAIEKARIGRGGASYEVFLPPDLEEVDMAVRMLEPRDKRVIAECYTHSGSHFDHMVRLQMCESTYFRRKKVAETNVYCLLQRDSEFLQSTS